MMLNKLNDYLTSEYNKFTPEQHRQMAMDLIQGFAGSTKPTFPFSVRTAPMELLVSHEGAPDLSRVEFYKKLLQETGKIDPLKIIREGAKYGIEDGKHRFEALRQLGYRDAPITLKW